MSRTLTAMFASHAEAERAGQMLVDQLRLDKAMVRTSSGDGMSDADYDKSRPYEDKGFFGGLKDLMVPDKDRFSYAEGLRRGSTLLSVQVDEAHMGRASDILEQAGAIDLDAQEETWKREGWTGYDATAASAMRSQGMTATRDQATTDDGTIKVVEERLSVGKRAVQGGSVRVRAYVVEREVEEQVTLRDETVTLERRPVDREATAADLAGFQEHTIEMTATDEEAVVAKEVRVVEEIGIRKEAADRVETVRDTVRRTQVDVEDTTTARTAGTNNMGKSGTGTTGAGAASGSNPPGTMASRAVDKTLDTNVSGANAGGDAPDGTPGNPPGTMASRAVDKALDTNISGANPGRKS